MSDTAANDGACSKRSNRRSRLLSSLELVDAMSRMRVLYMSLLSGHTQWPRPLRWRRHETDSSSFSGFGSSLLFAKSKRPPNFYLSRFMWADGRSTLVQVYQMKRHVSNRYRNHKRRTYNHSTPRPLNPFSAFTHPLTISGGAFLRTLKPRFPSCWAAGFFHLKLRSSFDNTFIHPFIYASKEVVWGFSPHVVGFIKRGHQRFLFISFFPSVGRDSIEPCALDFLSDRVLLSRHAFS